MAQAGTQVVDDPVAAPLNGGAELHRPRAEGEEIRRDPVRRSARQGVGQGGGEVAAGQDAHVRQAEPAGRQAELGGEAFGRVRAGVRLGVGGLDGEDAGLALAEQVVRFVRESEGRRRR